MISTRTLPLALGFLVMAGGGSAQAQNVRPQILISGEPNGAPQSLSADQIPQLESQVQSDPEDTRARAMLIGAYQRAGQNDKALEQMLWIVGHHPEWNVAPIISLVREKGGSSFTAADYQQMRGAWESALAAHPNDPEVLFNGAVFLQGSEGERALQLLRQARQLQPLNPKYLRAVAGIYEAAVLNPASQGTAVPPSPQGALVQRIVPVSPVNAELAARLSAELLALNDAALLSQVGGYLAMTSSDDADNPNRQLGLRLLERATILEPDNASWKAALERAMNPVPTLPPPPLPSPFAPPSAVRIGSAVAEASLIRKVELVYPALAKSARISGTVEFTAVIGTDGRITNLQLVRGHPLLVNAAREAVLQYIYKPTLLNGNPVPVMTSIVVGFELPPQ